MYADLQAAKDRLEADIGESIQDDDFYDWCNEWLSDMCAKIAEVRENYFRTSGSLAIVAGTKSYALSGLSPAPTRLIRVMRVENDSTGQKYPVKDLNQKDYDNTLGWELEGTTNIVWDPSPDASFTAKVYYINWPAFFDALTDTFPSQFPVDYIRTIKAFLKHKYYDSEEYGDDDSKSIRFLNIYTAQQGDMLSELDNEEAEPERVGSIPDGLE